MRTLPPNPSRRAALFRLALAAALAAGSVPALLHRAEAISASASEAASQPAVVSPRELGVSFPPAPTIRTVETPRAPAPQESAQSLAGDTAESRRAARRRRRQARAQGREEETTRTTERRSTTTTTTRREVAEDRSKEDSDKKTVVTPPPTVSPFQFTVSGGYQTRYIYHGLDIISFNSRYRPEADAAGNINLRRESSGIWFTDATLAWKGLRAGVTYIQAVDPTVPFFTNSGERGRSFSISGDRVSLYREVNVHLDYTAALIPRWLDGTIGYNSYFFPNTEFKDTAYQGEIPIRLTFTRIPYIRPSFTYYRYISDYKKTNEAGNLNGNYVEFRLDSAFPLYTSSNFAIGVAPYALVSYNINYLKIGEDVGGWNTFETGVKVPVRIGRHFTVTPFGNYGLNLSNDNGTFPINNFTNRGFGEKTRFWGGVNVAYTF